MLAAHLGNDTQVMIDERMLDSLMQCAREDFFRRFEIAGLQRLNARSHLDFERRRRSFLRRTPSCRGEKQQEKDFSAQATQKSICRRHRSDPVLRHFDQGESAPIR